VISLKNNGEINAKYVSCDKAIVVYNRRNILYLSESWESRVVHNVAVQSGCPEEFYYFESQHLCYHLVGTILQWQSASQYCRALDSRAHLLVIDNEDEQGILNQGLSELPRKYWKVFQVFRQP